MLTSGDAKMRHTATMPQDSTTRKRMAYQKYRLIFYLSFAP